MSQGIWVSPNEFVSFSELNRPSKEAVATRSRVNGSLGISGKLQNPDPVLRKMGKSIEVYRDLTADAHVGGCVRRRKSAVLALEHGFDRENANPQVVNFLENVLAKLHMRSIISGALDAPLFDDVYAVKFLRLIRVVRRLRELQRQTFGEGAA